MHDHHLCHNINAHGKYSNPQDHHLNYDAIIRNHVYCSQYRIHHNEGYLQRHFGNLSYYFQNYNELIKGPLQVSIKNPKYVLTKVHKELKTMANICCPFCRMHIAWSRGNNPCKQAQIQRTPARGRVVGMDNQPLFIPNRRTTGDPYKRTKPLRMN